MTPTDAERRTRGAARALTGSNLSAQAATSVGSSGPAEAAAGLASRSAGGLAPCWVVNLGRCHYGRAWDLQGNLARARHAEEIPDLFLLVEHDHVYTLGRAGRDENVLWDPSHLRRRGVEIYSVDRGGDVTYHGPGQVVGYPIVSLRERGLDAHKYLRDLEEVLIRALADFGIEGDRAEGMTGVWVDGAKIAAIGVKFTRAVTSHGFALNVNTDLSYFTGIVPCGLTNRNVTSMAALLGGEVDVASVHDALIRHFADVFERSMSTHSLAALRSWLPEGWGSAAGAG